MDIIQQESNLSTISNSFDEAFSCSENLPPETLYHYTSMDTLKKIIEGGEVQYTHARFMNDAQEVERGLEIVLELIEEVRATCLKNKHHDINNFFFVKKCALIKTLAKEDDINKMMDCLKASEYNSIKSNQVKIIEELHKTNPYIACFSEHEDSLPMWYMYADHGQGVAIGFNREIFFDTIYHGFRSYPFIRRHVKMIYCEDVFKKQVRTFLKSIYERFVREYNEYGNLNNLSEPNPEDDVSFITLHYLFVCCLSLKHKGFEHEKEWRMIIMSPHVTLQVTKDIDFISRQGLMKPCKRFPFYTPVLNPSINNKIVPINGDFEQLLAPDRKAINSLGLASGNPNEEEWIEYYLKIKGFDTTVYRSNIPYRNV